MIAPFRRTVTNSCVFVVMTYCILRHPWKFGLQVIGGSVKI